MDILASLFRFLLLHPALTPPAPQDQRSLQKAQHELARERTKLEGQEKKLIAEGKGD